MSGSVVLCGHTGSMNRGCEAIIRSTVHVLQKTGFNDIRALTHDISYDEKLGVNRVVSLQAYPSLSIVQRGFNFVRRKIFNDFLASSKQIYKVALKNMPQCAITFNVGGDTYCYGVPALSYALNLVTHKIGIRNVFWGCSVDDRCLHDKQMQADLNRYDMIIARETLSYELVRSVLEDKSKILLACDPAFHLPITEVDLPDGFCTGNTLGINLSHLVFSDNHDSADIMYQNTRMLIDYILKNTDMAVCLIPHVYAVEGRKQDLAVLDTVKSFYSNESRVILVDQELSCTQLKYIISKCRFFIGSRTHATIAAYSTSVPTIALSYSIKSRGIARDLFGTEKGYAIPWEQVKSEDVLKNAFVQILYEQEDQIRKRYECILPDYKATMFKAASEVMRRLS